MDVDADSLDSLGVDPCRVSSINRSDEGFGKMVVDGISQIPFKMMGILYILYLVFNSDIFNERILGKIDGAIEFGNQPSSYGVAIVGVLFIVFYATFQVMIDRSVL